MDGLVKQSMVVGGWDEGLGWLFFFLALLDDDGRRIDERRFPLSLVKRVKRRGLAIPT